MKATVTEVPFVFRVVSVSADSESYFITVISTCRNCSTKLTANFPWILILTHISFSLFESFLSSANLTHKVVETNDA
jgi:ABC-type Co2+ transport system permease subunit